ncbi:hypothetical protein ACTHGU_12650 [Chitinophagaceae bacterium MMS25-I14]
MKKLVLPAIIITFLFTACKKSKDSASVVGKWYLDYTSTKITADGTKIKDTTIAAIPSGQSFEFTKDSFLYEYLYDTASSTFYTDTFRYQVTADQIITSKPETAFMKILTGSELSLYTSWESSGGTATLLTETVQHFHR